MTPEHYGETVSNCPATLLLLRCWGIWRARLGPHGGWSAQRDGRMRILELEIVAVRAAIAAMSQPGKPILNSAAADHFVRLWFPDFGSSDSGATKRRRRQSGSRSATT